MPLALAGLVVLPVLAGLALLVAGRSAARVAAPLAVGVTTVVLVLAVVAAAGRPVVALPLLAGIDAGLAVDGLSAVLVLTVTTVALAVTVFATATTPRVGVSVRASRGLSARESGSPGEMPSPHRFFGLLLVFVGAMLATVTATNLLTLLAAWEVMGAMSYALIAHRFGEPGPPRSGATAFLVTRAGDVGLYVAAGAALAGGVGSLALADLPQAAAGWRDVLTAGLVLAALGKSAQLPFSFWLSRAMDGPSPVSALLHSATMVAAGGYLLLRVEPLLAGRAGPVVAWIGAATVVLLGLVALAQTDLKQLLAASTCSQVGFIVLAAGVGGTAGGTVALVAHAATKSLLFLVAGAWLTALGTRQLAGLRGAARRWPVVGAVFTAGALSLAGLPPLSIFFGKDAVLAAAAETSTALYVAGLLGVVVSAAYAAAALVAALGGPGDDPPGSVIEQRPTGVVPRLAEEPLVPLAVAAVLLGAATGTVREMLGATGEPTPTLLEALLSGVLASAVVAGVLVAGAGLPARVAARAPVLREWLFLGRLTRAVAAAVRGLATALARFDDRVVAGGVRVAVAGVRVLSTAADRRGEAAVDGTVRGAVRAGRAAARISDVRVEPLVRGGVAGLAAGSRALGRQARRPQTGLLHQYYAQAAGALAVLALFLVLVR